MEFTNRPINPFNRRAESAVLKPVAVARAVDAPRSAARDTTLTR